MYDFFGSINLNSKVSNWRVVKDSDLVLQCLGAETVVYNPSSGETHQTDDFSAVVLGVIKANQFNKEQLLKEICNLYPLEENTRIQQLLDQVINNFDQIGLIEPQY